MGDISECNRREFPCTLYCGEEAYHITFVSVLYYIDWQVHLHSEESQLSRDLIYLLQCWDAGKSTAESGTGYSIQLDTVEYALVKRIMDTIPTYLSMPTNERDILYSRLKTDLRDIVVSMYSKTTDQDRANNIRVTIPPTPPTPANTPATTPGLPAMEATPPNLKMVL